MSESAFADQSDILIPQVATAGSSTHEDDLEDACRNADLYFHIFNQEVFEDG